MKKLHLWLLLLIVPLVAACGSSDPTIPDGNPIIPEKPVEKDEISFTDAGNASIVLKSEAVSKEIEFTATKDWTVIVPSSAASWLSVSPLSGSKGTATITLSFQENKEVENRAAEITLSAGTAKKVIAVTQAQKDALVIAPNSFTLTPEGGEFSMEVGHNVDYELAIDCDWIHKQSSRSYVKDQLTFKVDKNPNFDNREGLLTFTSKDGSLKQEVKVYQSEMKGLIVSATDKVFDEKSHTFDVEIKANVDYTVTDPQVDWLKRVESRALTSRTLRYELQENTSYDSRTAMVIVSSKEGLSDTLQISQMQKDAIVIAHPSYTIGSDGGDIAIEVSHNVDYKTTIDSDWITQNTSRALTTDNLVFTIAKNPAYDNREGLIAFTSTDGRIKQEIKIYQSDKKGLIVSDQNLSFDDKAHEFDIEVKANVDYQVTDPAVSWIRRIESKALSSRIIHYTLSANEQREERTAEILFKSKDGSLTDKVTIRQSGYKVDEKAILEALYRATDGDHWRDNTNWCTDKPLDEWSGIETEAGHVTKIQLPYSNLKGQLPAELKELTSLQWFNVEENQLEGNLPDYVDNWKELRFLGLGSNNFTGSIPKSYANLTYLTYFSVMGNKLSGEYPFFMMEMPNWDKVIKDYLEPQQPGYVFTAPVTAQMIPLGNDLYLHPEGNAIELRWGKTEVIPKSDLQDKMKYLYTKFNDEFDFVHLIFNVPQSDHLHVKLAGESATINNTGIQGIGRTEVNKSSMYGSEGRLKGLLVTYSYNNIGVLIHEITHYWGAIDMGQETIEPNGIAHLAEVHWGIMDVNGILGGFKGETLQRNVDGNPKKYRAFSPDGGAKDFFWPAQMSSFSYAPIELYLMGMLSKDEVPVMTMFKGVSGTAEDNPLTNGVFFAEKEVKISIDDVIQKYGERKPSYVDAQKDFRIITIVATDDAVNDREWGIIQERLKALESDSPTERLSFKRATGNRGSLILSGIDTCRKQ